MSFLNIRGKDNREDTIIQELAIAQIPLFRKPDKRLFNLYGKKGEFLYVRAQDYYLAIGQIPLDIAEKIYSKWQGRIKALAHAQSPHPENWIQTSNGRKYIPYHSIHDQEALNYFVRLLEIYNLS